MFSEIKIYDPGLKKKGHVEVYIDGVRKRLYSGDEIGVDCSPNKSRLSESRTKEFHRLAIELEAALKDGWKPTTVIKKIEWPCSFRFYKKL